MDHIIMYCDGACKGNPGPMGIGVFLKYESFEHKISEYIGDGTNNVAELNAIRIGLENISNKTIPVKIYTDSKYCRGVLTLNWNVNANKELVEYIKNLMKTFSKIEIFHVKGHSGEFGNELVNELATRSIRNL